MKSIKAKVLTGVIAVGLVSGVGAAFADTDAGAVLKTWYDGKFSQSSASVQEGATNYGNASLEAFTNETNGLKTEATNSINATKTNETKTAKNEIAAEKNKHLKALNDKKTEILGYMDDQFDAISLSAQNTFNSTADQAYTNAYDNLKSHTESKGWDAYVDMNSQLASAEFDAIRSLEDAIYYAKADLQKQLDSESAATTQEIKDAIDSKIQELRTLISQKKDELVAAQQKYISDEARQRVENAKANLEATVIDNINQ
ncbi:hypothetical protein [Neobacillus dielmonensis]|uniref:hypothetical protein n=1 Tax=Neobacillus dielmonensis TaxID=1347369 RepID=UPI0005AA0506|nr:hypothetical protein [Neobacillus dielmonensis]